MSDSSASGQIVILNGAPRSGKSSIAAAIQETFPGIWVNIGVDVARAMTPPALQPGVGLRPGEPHHPAAATVPALYAALWESVAAHARLGLNVVVDVGLYELEVAQDAARRLAALPVLFVGVRCDVETIMARRRAAGAHVYAVGEPSEPVPQPVLRWQGEVHAHWSYDIDVDTATQTPQHCAVAIKSRLDGRRQPKHSRRSPRAAETSEPRPGQRSGMSPEEVRPDLGGPDEFLVVCRSLPRTDP